MLASFLCGAHYEGAEAQRSTEWPAPRRLFDPEIGQRTFDDYLDFARLAEDLGFDWISVSEHHSSPLILTPSVATVAGALSQVLKRARIALLGPLATLNNPIRVAEEIAMLDQLSHGRVIVLPLRGTPNEFNTYGPLDAPTTKGMTQEATLLIQKALSEEEPFRWQGEYFQFPSVSVWPGPVQRPFPPMLFSGNSPDSAAFAGKHRLGLCFSFHAPEVVARAVAIYREEAARAGWTPSPDQIVYRAFIVLADTAQQAAELEAGFLPAHRAAAIAANKRLQLQQAGNGAIVPDQGPQGFGLGRLQFAGTPDAVIQQIIDFQATTGVGVLDLIFAGANTPPPLIRHALELFGREVLPSIREVGALVAQR
jgi:alkanesulfonate monooxygenase SsuD/methylene tetrahydromethanopterin reductase-like flavin-dependent oxidoreductase (luciferase family)